MGKTLIAVSGSNAGDGQLTPAILAMAEEVGRGIAERGGVLLCGGLGGIMEAAARGAKGAGGLTVGIMPFGREKANRHIDVPLATGLGYARNCVLATSCDAMIAVCGRWGTLNEIAYAMGIEKPVVLLDGSGGSSALFSRSDVAAAFKRKPAVARTAGEAVALAFSLAAKRG